MTFSFDMTKAPMKIGHHDAERLSTMQQVVVVLARFAALPFQHAGDERLVDNCARMVKALYAAMHEQTWDSAELAAWWLTQHPPQVAEKIDAMIRAGDAQAFARYGQRLAERYPLPRFEIEDRA